MHKAILITIISLLTINLQYEASSQGRYFSKQFYYLPSDNNIATIMTDVQGNRLDSSSSTQHYIISLSSQNGEIVHKISLSKKMKLLINFSFSHNGLRCVVLSKDTIPKEHLATSREVRRWYNSGIYILRQYSLVDGKCEWEKHWYCDYRALGIAYNEDDSRIISVSTHDVSIIDSESGELIKKGDNLSHIDDINDSKDDNNLSYDISPNGVYSAFWRNKFLAWSSSDETIILRLLDISWYGIKWIYYLGSVPNYLYIWDNINDSLYTKIKLPYEETSVYPSFINNDKLLVGAIDNQHKIISLGYRHEIEGRSPHYDVSIFGKNPYLGNKTFFSPNNKYIGKVVGPNILLLDYEKERLIARFPRHYYMDGLLGDALGFSNDGKYFICAIKDNQIVLTETETGKLIWENKDFIK
jgi:hypothetical protein